MIWINKRCIARRSTSRLSHGDTMIVPDMRWVQRRPRLSSHFGAHEWLRNGRTPCYRSVTFGQPVIRKTHRPCTVVAPVKGVLEAARCPTLRRFVRPRTPWLTCCRLRPLHTNAVIVTCSGSALLATSYCIVQRTCHVTLFCGRLSPLAFCGWYRAQCVRGLPRGARRQQAERPCSASAPG